MPSTFFFRLYLKGFYLFLKINIFKKFVLVFKNKMHFQSFKRGIGNLKIILNSKRIISVNFKIITLY